MSTITATVQLRRDTAANWTANNPTLLAGELGFETDTKKAKLGDGVTAWNSLGYLTTLGLLTDGDKGDITVSSGGTVFTIDNTAVTFAKIQHIPTNHLLGRHTAGNGDVQEINIDGGLELNGANIRRAALTGDVTASAGQNDTTIANDAVTNAKLANMAQATIKGRQAGSGTGDPEDLTASQARTALGLGTAALNNTGDFDLATNTVRGRLASDFTTNSATFVDVAPSGVNFEVTLEANSTYWFYFYGIYQSTNTGTGVGLSFTFSNSPTVISLFTTRVANAAQAGTTTVPSLITASDGGNIANNVLDINTNLPNFSRGLIVTGANASVVRCRIARGGAANNVTLKAGSIILAHKIA